MPSVEFFFVPKDYLIKVCTKFKTRYARGHTVPGTRSYHVFIPKNVGMLSFKRIGKDKEMSGHIVFLSQTNFQYSKYSDYVVVKYDGH